MRKANLSLQKNAALQIFVLLLPLYCVYLLPFLNLMTGTPIICASRLEFKKNNGKLTLELKGSKLSKTDGLHQID